MEIWDVKMIEAGYYLNRILKFSGIFPSTVPPVSVTDNMRIVHNTAPHMEMSIIRDFTSTYANQESRRDLIRKLINYCSVITRIIALVNYTGELGPLGNRVLVST